MQMGTHRGGIGGVEREAVRGDLLPDLEDVVRVGGLLVAAEGAAHQARLVAALREERAATLWEGRVYSQPKHRQRNHSGGAWSS